ncbi:5-methyltetrahydropteroyltriglutamate--homocysteine S-methyltransferase [Luteolibacter sp. AS25]|uniref:5-methyltetrahydropteroyltriglutamate-- homocysteine S-methyltransferase n=1 Tax=Luteolibacter sp. AS25 TaxID=3135776 RepID=UPI00398AD816
MKQIRTHNLGYPRIGAGRELKKATEQYWKGKIRLEELERTGRQLRIENWQKQEDAGIDLIPTNDFSFYDQVLDTSLLLGNIPARFGWDGAETNAETAFLVARGQSRGADDGEGCGCSAVSTYASEMTKWFDTNYHYIVPEFNEKTNFRLSSTKIFEEFHEAKELGYRAKPVLLGPVSYLALGKVHDSKRKDFDRLELLDDLVGVYEKIISLLADEGAEWIQLDEPVLALDLDEGQRRALSYSYGRLKKAAGNTKLLVATYFGPLRDNLADFLNLPVDGLHYDVVRGGEEVTELIEKFPAGKTLSLGVVDGRNIWKNDFEKSLGILLPAVEAIGVERLWIAPSCSLLHVPVTLKSEKKIESDLANWLAFADEKLDEVTTLGRVISGEVESKALEENRNAQRERLASERIHNGKVKARMSFIIPADAKRSSDFPVRQEKQREKLGLPLFPITTIGSFPQTAEVRAARAQWRKGTLSDQDYDRFLEEETRKCVEFQDSIGIDMPVHGEFERNDMVEYFGEQLEGFAFTANGWVQSYGSRCVKPPIIFGDVRRMKPMTVRWAEFAQTLTKKPLKGMLTGPVTILQWSFVRNDQPRDETTRQIALAIRDEVRDLEAAGIAAIQIDEPAIREGLPLRRADWDEYLAWAVHAFRLSSSGVKDTTQIHTHMCYSDFNDIISAVADLDADVITIETSRSNMELLDAFVDFKYPNEIGPGVYDIHSPRVPSVEEMERLLKRAAVLIPEENLWVNPDCGLKTRGWEEVRGSLINMVTATKNLRSRRKVEA